MYLADFNYLNLAHSGFMRTKLNIESYSPLKPTQVGFIFIGPISVSLVKDLADVIHVKQAVVRVGS